MMIDDKQDTALFDTAFTFVPRELGVGNQFTLQRRTMRLMVTSKVEFCSKNVNDVTYTLEFYNL